VRRLLLLLLCVALLASIAIAAHAATLSVKVEDVTAIACNAPVVSSTTTVTTAPSTGGCQTSVVCPGKPDNHEHNNDNTCDGNNGGGNG
jgi:hypothetical protein